MTPLVPRLSNWQRFRQCALRRQHSQPHMSSPAAEQSPWQRVVGVARSLTVCTTLGALVVVSHVISDVAGSGTTLALLVTAFISMATEEMNRGFQHGFMSGTGSTYTKTYSKLGELAAFSVGLNSVLLDGASCALTARVISATLNQLTGGVIGDVIGRMLNQSEEPAVFDPIAGIVCCVTAGLISLGIERAMWMDVTMLLSTAFSAALYTISSALFSGHSQWQQAPFMPRGIVGFVDACGILSLVYRTRSIISTAKPEVLPEVRGTCTGSEPDRKPDVRVSARFSAVATMLLLFVYTNLASSASLLLVFNSNGTCCRTRVLDGLDPLPGVFNPNTSLLHSVSVITGCLATISLCFLTASLLTSQQASLNQLASDQLVPCRSSCHGVSAGLTAATAIFISSCWLLKLAAVLQLLSSACSVAVYVVVSHSRLKSNRDTTPSCYQISCSCCHGDQPSDQLTRCTAARLSSGMHALGRHGNECEYIQTPNPPDIPSGSEAETESTASGYESNNSEIEDIDSIVSEYLLENPQVVTKSAIENILMPEPTPHSSRKVRVCLGLLAANSALIGILLVNPADSHESAALLCVKITALVVAFLLISIISRQPRAKWETSWLCRQTWLQCFCFAAILVAIATVLFHVWIGCSVIVVFGFLTYTCYGMNNSTAHTRSGTCSNVFKQVQTSSSSNLMST